MGLTADTRITTTHGLRRVLGLVGKNFSAIMDGRVFRSSKDGFYLEGTKRILQICLENGINVRVCAYTRLMSLDGWKNANEVRKGDDLVLASGTGVAWDGSGTEDEGYIAGCLWGKGSPYGFSVLVSKDTDPDDFGPIQQIKKAHLFKTKTPLIFVQTGEDLCYKRYSTASGFFRELAKKFGLFDGSHAYENGSHAFTIGFLRGAFDSVGVISHKIHGNTTTISLRRQEKDELCVVQRMLMAIAGITPIIKEDELIIQNGWDMIAFQQKIGFFHNEKVRLMSYCNVKTIRKTNRTSKVLTVAECGKEEVYGCVLEGTNCVCANGVLANNSKKENFFLS